MTSDDDAGAADQPLVAVARMVKTRGLRGELVADILTDFLDRFDGLERLIAVKPDGSRAIVKLEEHWFQSGRMVLKFAGYDTIDEAAVLIGSELAVPEDERVALSEDEYYDWELKGCRVETVDGVIVGSVRDVMHIAGGEVQLLQVESAEGKREHLVPLAGSICVEIDLERRLIRIDPPDGLLEF